MAAKIQLRRDTSANWASVNPVLSQGEIGLDLTTGKIKIGDGSTAWSSLSYFVGNPSGINLNDLGDVVTSSVASGDFLRWDGSNWINDAVNLSTDTVGDYVASLTAGTGVTLSNNSGEGATPTVAIGQAVETSSSVTFAAVTTTGDLTVGGSLTVNGTTTTLNTETLAVEDNIVLLNSNVTGSPSTNAGIEVERGDSSNVVLRWNESTDSWEVTEDGSVYKNIAVGQDVETSSSVIFAAVTASTFTGNLVGNADTASQLATARTIALGGDLSGSVSFSGSTDVTINASVINSGISLDEISDVIITSPEEFQGLSYNGTNWVNSHIPLVSYVQNAEATTITTGTCVYLFGGTGDHASVKRADNSSDTTSSKTVGVAGANIAASQNGPIITRGYVDGIDLSVGYSPGDVLWLGENGSFTTTKPSAPDHLVFIGVVVRATNNGIIYVATQNGYELEELHDVKLTSPQNNDFLKYNSASAIWVNDPINLGTDTVGNYMTDVVAGSNNIVISHTAGEGSSASIDLTENIYAQTLLVGGEILGEGYVSWLGSTDFPGKLRWNPSALRDIYLPDVSGSIITSADTGTITSTMIANGTIDGSDISETAGIGLLKLQYGSSGQMIVAAADGTPTWRAITGDISVNASGVASIQENSVALGTDTTGDYVASLVAGTGVTLSNNSGESASPTIAIGQDVSSSAEVTFERVNIGGSKVAFEGDTANEYETTLQAVDPTADRTIYLPDSSGTIALTSASTGIVALGSDTTGDYVSSLVAGTGVTLSNNSGENASPTIAIGQSVATNASVQFYHIAMTGPVDASNTVATKQYVDQVAAGIDWHQAVVLATVAALPNSPTYDNGSSGSGATLTASANARLVIDGANAVTDTRVLVKNQADATQNGVYDVTEQGSASVAYVLTRAEDFDGDTGHEIYGGEAVFVTGGTVNIRQGFTVTSTGSGTAGAHEFGTDNVSFTQFTGTASFIAGDGLAQDGNTISVGTASSTRIVVTAHEVDLATVAQTNTTGTAGTSFVQSHTVDSYGRVTGTVTADVQDASTSAKGIARFNSGQFSVSSGSVSIADAGVDLAKLQLGSAGQIIVANSSGVPTYRTVSGDITISDSGVASIAANSVALGTDTTGNYVSGLYADSGIVITHTPGEGSTASIGLDSVIASSNSGSSGTNFLSAITVDGYGRVTAYTASDVQDASTSAKGIAQFSSSDFNVSSGSVSLVQGISTSSFPTFAGISISGTASVGSSASISGSVSIANNSARIKYETNKTTISTNANAGGSSDVLRIEQNYDMGSFASNAVIGIRNGADLGFASGIILRQTASVAGVEIGPRLAINSGSDLAAPGSLSDSSAASVTLYVDRHTSGSLGVVLKDSMSSSVNMLEWRDSSGTVYGSIGGSSASYRFNANSASLQSASVGDFYIPQSSSAQTPHRIYNDAGTLKIYSLNGIDLSATYGVTANSLTVSGDLTVNGTTTTVNSTTITVDDPIITLGGDAAPGSDDNKDRGIEFRYHSGTAASVGFMGYDDSTGRFIFLTGATNTSEVFSGTAASVEVGSLFISSAGGGVTLHGLLSTPTVKAEYSASIYATLESAMGGPAVRLNNNQGEGVIAIEGGGTRFTFSRPILSASLASASINAPVLSGSVHYDSSASVTLPPKTFFPEEYLTVSSSVTLNATTHRYATLEMTATSGTSVITVPADASSDFPVGSVIQIIRVGAGEVQVTASAGVTVNNALGSRLRAQWSTATLRKRAANTWLLSGDLKV